MIWGTGGYEHESKKTILIGIAVLILFSWIYYIQLPDYRIWNSRSNGNGSEKETELNVIIYKYMDGTIIEIEEEHNKIDGMPATLEINVYLSVWQIKEGFDPYKTVDIDY